MKIGFICMPVAGHLHPMTALGRRLQSRGHEVVFVGIPDVADRVRSAGLDFLPCCEREYPPGSDGLLFGRVARLSGFDVLRETVGGFLPGLLESMLRHLPGVLAEAGVEALVIDTTCFYAELVAMSLGLPYVHVWCILNIDPTGTTPPGYFGWPPEDTDAARERNAGGLERVGELLAPMVPIAAAYAERAGLDVDCADPATFRPPLAVISQTPEAFDFPGIPWPAGFHYAGPLQDEGGRASVPFPWEELDGRPLIYASLGTLVNGQRWAYKSIFGALDRLPDVQVVFSVGKNVEVADLGPAPPNTIVVPAAPQLDLLERAALCLTHAGLNTTLEALSVGVPLVAIPIGYEQPGVAARIAHHGVGRTLGLDDLTAVGLATLIREVLDDPSYRARARHFRRAIAAADGLESAGDAVERAFGVGEEVGAGGALHAPTSSRIA